ncbi:hypothetical protein ATX62_08920 [Oenococcus oeni]|uniref:Response regulator of the LytR/AlgR family n=1 Tax=Oenococcus oeni TaxID=1247 RepID=A0AAQ2ZGS5_OENOE|nr:LytTR family DNA-binding domain-containing protein [Oenococcus oeni]KGI02886.1 histidine kinase [Oenococcus oeni IOEB_C52]OIK55964.1 hypothetical protein ATW61_09665 [Oenococcus oeni]OIL37177.1 hypothetical protein ATX11_09060 [Oenococcus oeni]OIM23444.1 hypothetical protein ATX62_08920 [Oenococcus oeni]OIM62106.1 hypothetical protein ATX87_09150 [Oenococcus oeni]
MIKIKVVKIPENSDEEVLFHVHEITGNIQQAISILKSSNQHFFANTMDSAREQQLDYAKIVFAEYLNRQMFIYTTDKVYYVRRSLAKFNQQSPNYLVQVSKTILINLYVISSFETKINGNLLVTLNTGEQQIVSRKFVVHLRKQLKAFSLTS